MWIMDSSERYCGTCGVGIERWVLHNGRGERVVEATFCPICYPDLETIFNTREWARDAA
jgi:hypothetical protein